MRGQHVETHSHSRRSTGHYFLARTCLPTARPAPTTYATAIGSAQPPACSNTDNTVHIHCTCPSLPACFFRILIHCNTYHTTNSYTTQTQTARSTSKLGRKIQHAQQASRTPRPPYLVCAQHISSSSYYAHHPQRSVSKDDSCCSQLSSIHSLAARCQQHVINIHHDCTSSPAGRQKQSVLVSIRSWQQ
jgi:hypothetical protein